MIGAFQVGVMAASLDPDAVAYLIAVETADGQTLEPAVRQAINDFIIGCKADGIWSAIKASCILAGARTLSGALVPLVGSAPTNNNFVSGDYNRETGLVGNGSTKYLDSNRLNTDDPQNNIHVSCYVSTTDAIYLSSDMTPAPPVGTTIGGGGTRINCGTRTNWTSATGFVGASRNNSSSYQHRISGTTSQANQASVSVASSKIEVYRQKLATNLYSSGRIAFYSIGEDIDLAKLDARISALITTFGSAI